VRAASTGLLLAAALALLPGCGGSSTPGTPTDKALACVQEKGLPARKTDTREVQVGSAGVGPKIVFMGTVGGAESAELTDAAPGAEQVGRALLYVNRGSESELEKIERCLEDLAG
jgi:hypothetical protein